MVNVIAMGGNSLVDMQSAPTVANQFATTRAAVEPVADLIVAGERLVLTHGNGPQVGFMQRRVELSRGELHDVPLDSLVADSQGALGYMIERDLQEALASRGSTAEVAALVTLVEVDPEDPAFARPTKPIGSFLSEADARRMERDHGWNVVEDAGRGWRRVVASPAPRRIRSLPAIRTLIDAGITVVACGGGGIPVTSGCNGGTSGVEAVIDKDLASALLAAELAARRLVITTGVDGIYRGFGGSRPERLGHVTTSELRRLAAAGEFAPGSMGPKVEAAIQFLECGGETAVICHVRDLTRAWSGCAGTHIRRG